MERLLITGVDTLVGSNLALWLAGRFQVVGLYSSRRVALAGCDTRHCDLADPCRVALAVHAASPNWIIHCGPLARSSWDVATQPPPASEVLVGYRLARAAMDSGSKLTVITGDSIVAGRRMFSSENNSVTAVSDWARIACELEHVLRKTAALVVRTHVYGWSSSANEPGYASLLHQAFSGTQPVAIGMQCHANPILATDLAELLVLAYRSSLSGTLHLAGAERVGADEFARQLATAFGSRIARLRFASSTNERESATETSLDTTRARMLLGTPMPLLREGLARFAAQASDFRWRLRGSEAGHRKAA